MVDIFLLTQKENQDLTANRIWIADEWTNHDRNTVVSISLKFQSEFMIQLLMLFRN